MSMDVIVSLQHPTLVLIKKFLLEIDVNFTHVDIGDVHMCFCILHASYHYSPLTSHLLSHYIEFRTCLAGFF